MLALTPSGVAPGGGLTAGWRLGPGRMPERRHWVDGLAQSVSQFLRATLGNGGAMQETSDADARGDGVKRDRHGKHYAAFEGVLLFSRWLQLPLLFGLIVALVIVEVKFAEHLVVTISNLGTFSKEQALLLALDLIDMVLIANLVVMVVISGYETFISTIHIPNEPSIPAWMRRSTAAKLKLRIATTILLISTIHLLHIYLDPAHVEDEEVIFMLVAQGVFIVTAAAFVLFDWLGSRTTNEP